MPLTLDIKDLAKYPFLKEAQEEVSRRTPSLERFIESNYGRNILNHAAERVISAIRSGRDGGQEEIRDAETDLFSYAFARIIVTCLGERGIIERHSRYEAARASSFLKEESPELRQFVGGRIGIDVHADRLPVALFTELTSSLRDGSWRLVNREITGGSVLLQEMEIDDLLRERVRSILAKQFPLPVPKALCETIAPVLSGITASYQEQILQQFGEVDEESFPPCINALIKAITEGTNLPHQGRFAITAFLHAIGLTPHEIVELYCRAPDFDVEKTLYQVEHITGARGTEYTAPSCATLKTYGFCSRRDPLCEHVNHPLGYYLIRKKRKKAEKSDEHTKESPS
ncbi:MAG: DNA primase large subunit PriL, partial [Methanomicrobiales archaeon]|nr:DNA primase large subunit PriL [Methanomicrobiales archaeon]